MQHLVQVNVTQHRGYHSTPWSLLLQVAHPPLFQHSCFQPLSNQAQQHCVTHPPFDDLPKVFMTHNVEKLSDVQTNNPSSAQLHEIRTQHLQRIMGQPLWSEPGVAVQKILLLKWFKHHLHRSLEHLVIECRHPNRMLLLLRCTFWDVHPTQKQSTVGARIRTL